MRFFVLTIKITLLDIISLISYRSASTNGVLRIGARRTLNCILLPAMTIHSLKLAAISLAVAFSTPAFAGLTYSTGQDLNNDGADDAFTVNGSDAFLVTKAAHRWPALPNAAITSGRYISWDADQSNRPLTFRRGDRYDFAFNFNWNAPQVSTSTNTRAPSPMLVRNDSTMFDFRWISDDYLVDVLLNGNSLGVNNLGKSQVWTVSNSASGFGNLNAGLNTIHFLVNNNGGGAVGLAADFTIHGNATPAVAVDVPEPASLALMGVGMLLLAARRKRRA